MLSRALRRVRRGGDDGFTLADLLVSMSLLSIAGALAVAMLITTATTTDRAADGSISTAGARTTMSAWTGLLQVAVVPTANPADRNLTVTPTSMTFNAQLGNLPSCSVTCTATATTQVTLRLINNQLVQSLTVNGTTTTTVQVNEGAALVPATGSGPACLFRPYRSDGTALDCGNLTAAASSGVTRIDLAFQITPRTGGTRTFTSSARLPGGTT